MNTHIKQHPSLDIESIYFALANNQNIIEVLNKSKASAEEIESALTEKYQNRVFGIISDWKPKQKKQLDFPLIKFLGDYGFKADDFYANAALRGWMGMADAFLKIGAKHTSGLSLKYMTNYWSDKFITKMCTLDAYERVLDAELSDGYDINFTDKNNLTLFASVCFSIFDRPRSCKVDDYIRILNMYLDRGASYLIATDGPESCLSYLALEPRYYSYGFKVLDALIQDRQLKPLPGDITNNPMIEQYLTNTITNEASRRIADVESLSSQRKFRV